jgi:hypothetical protein
VSASRGKPYLTWRPPEVDLEGIEDADHRKMLLGSLACGLEDFKRAAVDALDAVAEAGGPAGIAHAPKRKGAEPDNASPLVCISADSVDRPLGHELLAMLGDLGAEALVMDEPPSGFPADQWPAQHEAWRRDYEQTLVDSDGLLVVYGQTQPTWVQSRLAASRKMIASRRAATLSGLLEGPPPAKPALGIQLRNLSLLDCRAGLAPGPLKTYVQRLRQGGGAAVV